MPHLVEVAVHFPHHRFTAVAHLAGHRVGADGRALVYRLEPRRAVR
jgi:hypothetical protein